MRRERVILSSLHVHPTPRDDEPVSEPPGAVRPASAARANDRRHQAGRVRPHEAGHEPAGASRPTGRPSAPEASGRRQRSTARAQADVADASSQTPTSVEVAPRHGRAGRSRADALPPTRCRPGRYLNRELSWLDFNARVLTLAEDPAHPAAGAGQVPGHLRQQPGRVLHGPGGRPDASPADRPAGAGAGRAHPARAARPDRRPHDRADGPPRGLLHQRGRAGAGRASRSRSCAGSTSTRPTGSGCAPTSASRSSRC